MDLTAGYRRTKDEQETDNNRFRGGAFEFCRGVCRGVAGRSVKPDAIRNRNTSATENRVNTTGNDQF